MREAVIKGLSRCRPTAPRIASLPSAPPTVPVSKMRAASAWSGKKVGCKRRQAPQLPSQDGQGLDLRCTTQGPRGVCCTRRVSPLGLWPSPLAPGASECANVSRPVSRDAELMWPVRRSNDNESARCYGGRRTPLAPETRPLRPRAPRNGAPEALSAGEGTGKPAVPARVGCPGLQPGRSVSR